MANATTALQNGFNYQARVFWLHAFDLLIPATRVSEVHFEASQPKAFDDDEGLRPIIASLRIVDGYRSLEELRREVNTKAVAVGLKPCDEARSDFRYDALAQALKARQVSPFSKASLETILREEGLWLGRTDDVASAMSVVIHSFLGLATDLVPTTPENTLFLTDLFRQRYLAEGHNW